ncbi:hypothetical protein I4U23_030096 [Adineta vaga]|nr:hypothetical protein I4U23_030096 [Adineta vaga]
MGNDNQFVDQPPPAFIDPTLPTRATKDGIIALQTPVEPIDCRQTLLNEEKSSTKPRRSSSSSFLTVDKIFAIALFILLIILIAYILFHGKITDVRLSRLTDNVEFKSNDIRTILEEINRTLKSIEHLLVEQKKKTNINLQLNGQDVREFYTNQTVLQEFLRRFKDRL